MTHQQVAKYECADTAISAERLWRVAIVLEVEPAYFYDGLGRSSVTSHGTADAPDRGGMQRHRRG